MTRLEDGRVRIEADTDIQGIAPGQFAVVYTADGILCAGSGEIALDLTKQTPPAIQPGSTLH
jgi:tRNA U34 2-thiouridine synthase MnmA/TrmU